MCGALMCPGLAPAAENKTKLDGALMDPEGPRQQSTQDYRSISLRGDMGRWTGGHALINV